MMEVKKTAMARRSLVVEAAATVFMRYGYARTTMQDIAQAAGLTRPTLYLTFADKESVFHAVIETLVVSNLAAIREGLPEKASLAEQLRHACESWCVPGFDIVRVNPDARDLFDLAFAPVRESYAAFEDLLVEILRPHLPMPASRAIAAEYAHMIGGALKGFKDIAVETAELRQLIGTLADAVGTALAVRVVADP
jgi:AcrR family transcriptional regulator